MTRKIRKVTVKQPGFLGGKSSRISIPSDCILVEFKSMAQKRSWFEVRPYPHDGRIQVEDPPRTVLLDGTLSENGGKHVTVDADRGVQVGYRLGEITRTVVVEEEVAVATPGGVTGVIREQLPRVEVVGVAEWVGIDGVRTLMNEEDVSLDQINASGQDWLKTIQRMVTIGGIALVVNGVAFILNAIMLYKASGLKIPHLGG